MVKLSHYIPDRGDLIWLDFSPQKGREQAHRRPAVAVSPKSYNKKTGLGLFCPITSQIKGYPFEIIVKGNGISGAILADQIRNLDWVSRNASFVERLPAAAFDQLREKLLLLIE